MRQANHPFVVSLSNHAVRCNSRSFDKLRMNGTREYAMTRSAQSSALHTASPYAGLAFNVK